MTSFDPSQTAATAPPAEKQKRGRGRAEPAEPQPTNGQPPPAGNLMPAGAAAIVLEIPIHVCYPGYSSSHLDVNHLTARQAAAAQILWSSLADRGARYRSNGVSPHPDGRIVDAPVQALRWFLDQLAAAIEAETGLDLARDLGGLTFRNG